MRGWKPTGGNKYGSKTCRCFENHLHDSIGESRYCNKLNLLAKAKEIYGYRTQERFELRVNGKKICDHIVDFGIYDKKSNLIRVEEFKGFPTAVWHLKHKLFRAIYPDIPYEVKTLKDLI